MNKPSLPNFVHLRLIQGILEAGRAVPVQPVILLGLRRQELWRMTKPKSQDVPTKLAACADTERGRDVLKPLKEPSTLIQSEDGLISNQQLSLAGPYSGSEDSNFYFSGENYACGSIYRLSRAVAVFKEALGYEATTHLLMTFLYIARNDGCSMQDLERATGATGASNSRNTDWLSYGRNAVTNNGLGLIKKERPLNQKDRRKIVLSLTSKGKELLKTLSEVLYR
ncbi:MarR family transcriptional regulator [cyanobiont of Ornithocercus magnificus]|nr:MarR family transcriptional regulator [cyanobiont of Ornithocercus magnificus]